jgi:hypothetical protein
MSEKKLISEEDAAIAAIDLSDPETQQAALKIQAGFRGHQTRAKLKRRNSSRTLSPSVPDIDLNDPELNAAATLIQASFRGHKVCAEYYRCLYLSAPSPSISDRRQCM